jgi:3-deoxy-7-phosphoheptulonate synthase
VVYPGEVDNLREEIAQAARGERFILQGGDCVERFADCTADSIINKIKILLQMSVILTYGMGKPVLKVGRIAGQFAKPRSNETEVLAGRTMLTYRGDSINSDAADPEERRPDPNRLLTSYYHAAATLNYVRSMIDGGFADLHHPYTWNLFSIEKTDKWADYREVVERILDAIRFMESFDGVRREELGRVDFYTSHEGLHLGYEEAMTRADQASGAYYNQGAHMLWIGERTRSLCGAHVEYFRGIANPIGLKIGPAATPGTVADLIRRLDPHREPGRLTLITRLGRDQVEPVLPGLIHAVRELGHPVAWSCDPMHGNTVVTGNGVKTRRFSDVLDELSRTAEVHLREGSIMAGVHFELTGESVTECTGGAVDVRDSDLGSNYRSSCDPRLNYAQAMEMAFLIARLFAPAATSRAGNDRRRRYSRPMENSRISRNPATKPPM